MMLLDLAGGEHLYHVVLDLSGVGMRNLYLYLTLLVLMLAGGCSTVQVSQDYRPGVDFFSYTGYQWRPYERQDSVDPRVSNPLLHERFQLAIERQMSASGFQVHQDAPLEVSYSYTIRTKVESDPFSTSVGFGIGRHTRYGGIGFGTVGDIRQYDVGMLVIDIYERRSGNLLWRGSGSEIVPTHSSPEETTAFVDRMVNSIMQQFPPSS